MSKIDAATAYLLKDELSNCGMLHVLRRGSARVLQAADFAALLFDEVSGAYMLSSDDAVKAAPWLDGLPDPCLFQLDDLALARQISAKYWLKTIMECRQFVYTTKQVPTYQKNLTLAEPTDEEMQLIRRNRDLLVGHDASGEVVGFIGCHLEGSMGLLEVLPQHRRKGSAASWNAA